MLCQFTFENFRAFRDSSLLDFYADDVSEHSETLLTDVEGDRFLPVISIFGPNSGGKSTVLDALLCLKTIVVRNRVLYGSDCTDDERAALRNMVERYSGPQYYLFRRDASDVPTKFEIVFRHGGYEYSYAISLLGNIIETEDMYCRKLGKDSFQLLFDRNREEIEIGELLPVSTPEKLSETTPFFTFLSNTYRIEVLDNAMDWFMSIRNVDYDVPGRDKLFNLPGEGKDLDAIERLLEDMDIPIKGFRVEEEDGKIRKLYTIHEVDGDRYELDYDMESSGTRKVISCLSLVWEALREGRMLIADELDAKLHPYIIRYLIGLFTDPTINRNKAQLLLTSHDLVNMDSSVFRRDEIWFSTKTIDSCSRLYALSSFRDEHGDMPRKDAKFSKRYMEGHYGADPFISKTIRWEV